MKQIRDGLLIGVLVGVLDVATFKFVFGLPVSMLDALGAFTFWVAAGLLVHTSAIRIPPVIKGVVIAVTIGVAWVVDALNRGKPEEVGFLLAIFAVYGAVTGFVSGKVGTVQAVMK